MQYNYYGADIKYNFDQIVDRTGTNALKLEGYKGYIFNSDDSLNLPFKEDEYLELFFAKEAGVLIESDTTFVDHANRMVRLNLACPRSYLEEGLNRMADAINNKHNEKFAG
ncbi:hypothetical protein [Anaerococcus sp. Marseille-Q5996]|uniref:hypothetical protein n=1 Tax=Anaerococcus sp. Marseille-Q5996 TaxID=2972769 RepID=UPI0021C7AF6A|nr:hypothetical protein [Anaerococcus sp. Marseille-Q5996]